MNSIRELGRKEAVGKTEEESFEGLGPQSLLAKRMGSALWPGKRINFYWFVKISVLRGEVSTKLCFLCLGSIEEPSPAVPFFFVFVDREMV